MGNMGSGRDIYTSKIWQEILTKCSLNKMDPTIIELTNKIFNYEQIEKRDVNTIKERQQHLNTISQLCTHYLNHLSSNIYGVAHKKTKKLDGPITPWIEQLQKDAKKKSEYLSGLFSHLSSTKNRYVDRTALIEHLKKRDEGNTFSRIKLFSGTLMERIDFLHRQFEMCVTQVIEEIEKMKIDSDNHTLIIPPYSSLSMNGAFLEWLMSDENIPFFLWLEAHPILTSISISNDNTLERSPKISRVDYKLEEALTVRLDNSNGEGCLLAKKRNSTENEMPLTSQAVKHYSFKYGSRYGSIAFIWTIENEDNFITHPHSAGKYHHSSLNGGKSVRCAGMWNVVNGKITAISNSSGHYKPKSLNFYLLIKFLQRKNVLSDNVLIADLRRPEEPQDPSKPLGSAKSKYVTLNDYLQWAESLDEVKKYQSFCATNENISLFRNGK